MGEAGISVEAEANQGRLSAKANSNVLVVVQAASTFNFHTPPQSCPINCNSLQIMHLIRVFLLLLAIFPSSFSFKLSHFLSRLSIVSLISIAAPCYPTLALEIQGTVTLKEGAVVPPGENVALYITAKSDPGLWTSAVRSIKLPPVLTKRITPANSFPLEFTLSDETDMTPEGIATAKEWQSGNLPLLFSARLDSDGVAATRGPDDLVGQGTSNFKDGSWERVSISLEGRGVAGKFITQPNK